MVSFLWLVKRVLCLPLEHSAVILFDSKTENKASFRLKLGDPFWPVKNWPVIFWPVKFGQLSYAI